MFRLELSFLKKGTKQSEFDVRTLLSTHALQCATVNTIIDVQRFDYSLDESEQIADHTENVMNVECRYETVLWECFEI